MAATPLDDAVRPDETVPPTRAETPTRVRLGGILLGQLVLGRARTPRHTPTLTASD